MNNYSKHISSELILQRHGNGVKLHKANSTENSFQRSVLQLFQLPLNVYFQDCDSKILCGNEPSAKACGFISAKDAIGKTIRDTAKRETAERIINSNYELLKMDTTKITEEPYFRYDDFYFTAISMKFPWYGDNDKINGLFGFSILTGIKTEYTLSEALTMLTETNLLSSMPASSPHSILPGSFLKNTYFTQREKEVFPHLIRGRTAKRIAATFGLSVRTIETYIANIKIKMCVSSKAELIEKIIDEYIY